MVASTDIKFYVYTNNNAPQLQNAYGSMINVLDACLVNGINIGTMSSLTASGTTVTALFSSAHNLMQYQVIKIAGASQPEFNGEHRILTVPNAQSVTFELAAAPSTTTATGTITASLPPLGWEKPFSSSNPTGGGKAAYRSKNLLLSSRPFLRVVDELDPAYTANYAKYAKVGIVEDMTDIDTMLGVQAPFDAVNPDKNWVGVGSGTTATNGWAKWYYARAFAATATSGNNDSTVPVNGNRKWLLVGDGDCFYIVPSVAADTVSNNEYGLLYGFGKFDSLIQNDVSNTLLSATIYNFPAGNSSTPGTQTGLANQSANTLIQRKYNQSNTHANAGTIGFFNTGNFYPGASNYVSVHNLILSPVALLETSETPSVMRGQCKNLRWPLQQEPYPEMQVFIDGDELFIAKKVAVYSASRGQIVFKIGDMP
ncbi:hypothetical protein [Acinetobacter sp. RF14B]|uniref:hypothetical protein n=1 Tax=Acinetobacter sp. RF14B TaxID=2650965 RepID=UPI0011721EF4|nr:hypothetical protein [Acinetobacter sp. RF14B]TQR72600.1 hypothetical protein E2K52_01205 [Acinetobacter sp. RF14B]